MKQGKITIIDIAEKTGLSKGTVDRVIHNRGEVSAKSREKVLKAIREFGYEPNLHASLLASGHRKNVVLLIPSPASGSFWTLSAEGMKNAAETVGPLGIDCKTVTYDQYDLASFRVACDLVLDSHPDGVVLAPMFHYESFSLGERLHAERIPFVLVDSKIENKNYLAYFGMQEYASGYLCGDQLTQGKTVERVLIVRISPDRDRQADPTAGRRTGFLDYLAEHCPGCEVIQTFVHPSDPVQIRQAMEEVYAAHPGIRHIVMFNSRIHRIVPFLEAHPDPQRRVVGFDNLAENMAALRKGTISVLIGQRPGEQVARAIQALADYLLLDKKPAQKDNHVHMDILTRYNIDYY